MPVQKMEYLLCLTMGRMGRRLFPPIDQGSNRLRGVIYSIARNFPEKSQCENNRVHRKRDTTRKYEWNVKREFYQDKVGSTDIFRSENIFEVFPVRR